MRFLPFNYYGILFIILVIGCSVDCSSVKYLEQGSQSCILLDSMYARAFIRTPFTLRGKATFDVDQRRFRGAYELVVHESPVDSSAGDGGTLAAGRASAAADKAFSFTGNTLFGAGREDVSIYINGGIMKIFDRERGEYYEAEEAERVLEERLGVSGGFDEMLDVALGLWRPCLDPSITVLRIGGGGRVFSGKNGYGDFRVDLSAPGGKLREIIWPFEFSEGEIGNLRVQYRWSRRADLQSVVLSIDKKKWRSKLSVSEVLHSRDDS